MFIVLRIYNFAESADLGLGNLISLELNSIKHEKCIFWMQMTWVVVIIKMDSKSFEKSKRRAWFFLLLSMFINRCHHKKRQESLLEYLLLSTKQDLWFFFNFWQTKNLNMTKSYPYCEGNYWNPLILKFSNWSLFYTSSFTLDFFHYSLHILFWILLLFSTSKN